MSCPSRVPGRALGGHEVLFSNQYEHFKIMFIEKFWDSKKTKDSHKRESKIFCNSQSESKRFSKSIQIEITKSQHGHKCLQKHVFEKPVFFPATVPVYFQKIEKAFKDLGHIILAKPAISGVVWVRNSNLRIFVKHAFCRQGSRCHHFVRIWCLFYQMSSCRWDSIENSMHWFFHWVWHIEPPTLLFLDCKSLAV